ncbi:Tex-like N-terminal domain-containing protein [Ureaplasma diversum]|uniref:Tex domain/RNA binding domain protein n=1 Tax=Ureaplasma diversum NCTC 246 TaxID=1188241 RepID=A0A084F1F1_9BACT|nr:Tex-like N-terminal domain-containing protein [Ureaplasma diversum]KEZ24043.1 Tex domain/RNA binding domain protein [Ureaplasma diversum NCTC 246]
MENNLISVLANKLNLDQEPVSNVLDLLADDNTIAFIARYRKHLTKNMDEFAIAKIADEYNYLVKLNKRKEAILANLEQKQVLTEDLKRAIEECSKLIELEIIYHPYATNKKTRASVAIANNLLPFAETILKNRKDIIVQKEAVKYLCETVLTVEDAINGACDIIAEKLANDSKIRDMVYTSIIKYGKLITKANKLDLDPNKNYEIYYAFNKPVQYLEAYQIMAIDRAVDQKVISVKYEFSKPFIVDFAINKYTKKVESDSYEYIKRAVIDGFERLLVPSVTNAVHTELVQNAHIKSANIFASNLQQLLLQQPIKNKTVLGFDPGYAHGCKLAIIKENNELLTTNIIYPHPPQNKTDQAEQILVDLIKKYNVNIIAIGNGTAANESCVFVSNVINKHNLDVNYCVVSEDGASIYSASEIAAAEFPKLPVERRSAISIARRVIDPLAELIKIDPKSIGVGQYQHDINQKTLTEKVDFSVAYCVNQIGVDVNTASVPLLSRISGLNKRSAQSIFDYVAENKQIKSRAELKSIKFISDKVFELASGFLRVNCSDNWLDKTSVHPESYNLANQLLTYLNKPYEQVVNNLDLLNNLDPNKIANDLNTDVYTLELIINNLKNPLLDIRDQYDFPLLRNKVISFDDLSVGMEIIGVVRNLTQFGAFVDIGVKNTALLHQSQFKNQDIKINKHLNVVILEINKQKEQIKLGLVE